MPVRGATVYTLSGVYDIDYWKRYVQVDGGGYVADTPLPSDYKCPSQKVGDQQVYVFNAPATIPGDAIIGAIYQYQWRPALYDADIPNAINYYVTSIEYTVVEITSSNLQRRAAKIMMGKYI